MALDVLMQRINSLKLSGVYSGTLCEYDLDDYERYELALTKFKVIKRDCKKYPYYITWIY